MDKEKMSDVEIVIKGEAKEIAALVLAIQGPQKEDATQILEPGISVVLNGR